MTFRPMPVMSILMIPALAVLIWLGSWQWARFQEKRAMPDLVPEAEQAAFTLTPLSSDYQFVYTTFNGESLWRVMTPVTACPTGVTGQDDPTCLSPMLANIGLLNVLEPEEVSLTPPDDAFAAQPFVSAVGHSRSMFAQPDFPEKAVWYTPDPAAIASALELSLAEDVFLEPISISVIRVRNDGEQVYQTIENPYANPARVDDLPPSRHLGYALTWYGLAIGLIGVYLALHIARGRLRV
ncbi:MAG: hypothetical protein CMK07_13810 [Ponticaulis sp.]|nr:hypothetical protein [Ponticaulis sp.]